MVKAIRIHEFGGPEVLTWEDIEVGEPGSDACGDRSQAVLHAAVRPSDIDLEGQFAGFRNAGDIRHQACSPRPSSLRICLSPTPPLVLDPV